MNRNCVVCGADRPSGRTLYCGDNCRQWGAAQAERRRQEKRMKACGRCGASKSLGVRGGKYCDECRRVIADSSAMYDAERSRRRSLAKIQHRLDGGASIRRRQIDAPTGMKWCARCQAFRPLTSFAQHRNKPAAYCRPCNKAYNQERRMITTFGISWDEYDLLLQAQDGRCAICEGRPRRNILCVDHDHSTGEIRGLLCRRCNHRLLGSAHDSAARLRKAADYLEAFAPRAVWGGPRHVPGSQELIK